MDPIVAIAVVVVLVVAGAVGLGGLLEFRRRRAVMTISEATRGKWARRAGE